MGSLRLHELTGHVVTTSNDPSTSRSHLQACHREVDRISTARGDDVVACGFKNASQAAFDEPVNIPAAGGTCSNRRSRILPTTTCIPLRPLHTKSTIGHNERIIETLFGTFRLTTRMSRLLSHRSKDQVDSEEEDLYEQESAFSFVPASWLIRFGFASGVSARISRSSLTGLAATLDVARSVPDEAPIFQFCRKGHLAGVRALIEGGQASVKDVDSFGRTPLFVSFSEPIILA